MIIPQRNASPLLAKCHQNVFRAICQLEREEAEQPLHKVRRCVHVLTAEGADGREAFLNRLFPISPRHLIGEEFATALEVFQPDGSRGVAKAASALRFCDWLHRGKVVAKSAEVIEGASPAFYRQKAQDRLFELASACSEKICALQDGEWLIVPGGWNSKKNAHAVLFLLEKEPEGYTFSVINTGLGMELREDGCAESVSYSALSKEAAADVQLFERLFALEIFIDSTNCAGQLAWILSEHFEARHGVSLEFRHQYASQTWGNCSFLVMYTALKLKLDKAVFAQFFTFLQMRAKKELRGILSCAYRIEQLDPLDARRLQEYFVQGEDGEGRSSEFRVDEQVAHRGDRQVLNTFEKLVHVVREFFRRAA